MICIRCGEDLSIEDCYCDTCILLFDTGEYWCTYIVECSDGTLYTGVTNNLKKRIDSHNKGTGAKYTKYRRPVKLIRKFLAADKKSAFKLEYKIKQLSRKEKLEYKEK